MRSLASVGVDHGGTWIRLSGIDSHGHRAWSLRKPAPSVEKLPSFLRKVLAPFRKDLCRLTVASRGVWTPSKRAAVHNALRGIAAEVTVLSDVEAAWLAAFKKSGIVVISGTGSIAYGRSSSGRSARAGGLGPDKGDEGSGYWIGKEWLRRTGTRDERRRTRQTVRQIALRTSKIVAKAISGDRIAQILIQDAQAHLANLVVELARKLRFKKLVPLATHGSVLSNAWFRRGFLDHVRRNSLTIQTVPCPQDVAFTLAAHLSSLSPRP